MKTQAPIWLMFSALSAFWGCQSTVSGPGTTPPEWQQFDSDCEFYFEAPSDMEQQDITGVDSCVGMYRGPAMELSYDYGGYSDPLDGYGDSPEYVEESATIDGFQAKVISLRFLDGRELPYVVAAHFPDVGKAGIKLTMWVDCKGPTEVETARLIIDSISFP